MAPLTHWPSRLQIAHPRSNSGRHNGQPPDRRRHFPYLCEDGSTYLNPVLANKNRRADWERQPIRTDSLPGSLSKVPFTWYYYDEQFEMEFLAGFTGFTQDKDSLQLRPKIGWAVREAKKL